MASSLDSGTLPAPEHSYANEAHLVRSPWGGEEETHFNFSVPSLVPVPSPQTTWLTPSHSLLKCRWQTLAFPRDLSDPSALLIQDVEF